MPNVLRTFFRHCPNCGRRFEIRLTDEKEVEGSEETIVNSVPEDPTRVSGMGPMGSPGYAPGIMVLPSSTVPLVIKERELKDTYRCGHCGHTWTELRHDETSVKIPPEDAADFTEDT
jgi:hypothetical protein